MKPLLDTRGGLHRLKFLASPKIRSEGDETSASPSQEVLKESVRYSRVHTIFEKNKKLEKTQNQLMDCLEEDKSAVKEMKPLLHLLKKFLKKA
ncbi:hypothetical protein LguiB_009477 [Lonicera macranthoides]